MWTENRIPNGERVPVPPDPVAQLKATAQFLQNPATPSADVTPNGVGVAPIPVEQRTRIARFETGSSPGAGPGTTPGPPAQSPAVCLPGDRVRFVLHRLPHARSATAEHRGGGARRPRAGRPDVPGGARGRPLLPACVDLPQHTPAEGLGPAARLVPGGEVLH